MFDKLVGLIVLMYVIVECRYWSKIIMHNIIIHFHYRINKNDELVMKIIYLQ